MVTPGISRVESEDDNTPEPTFTRREIEKLIRDVSIAVSQDASARVLEEFAAELESAELKGDAVPIAKSALQQAAMAARKLANDIRQRKPTP